MTLSRFSNATAMHRFDVALEPEVQTLMRVIEQLALRGELPRHLRFFAPCAADAPARLSVLGCHDARVVKARVQTLVGAIDAALRQDADAATRGDEPARA